VSGSDNYDSYLVEAVRGQGIPVVIGHRAENVRGADLLVYSAAISPENPERLEASRLNIPQMERSTLLGQLMQGYGQAVGVSGTHGKTTATAMLSQALVAAGLDPAVHIGGNFDFIGGGTRIGAKDIFVAEACEFHASFLEMRPTVAVVLNIEEDHLDYYRDLNHITETFGRFVAMVPPDGFFVGNGDDPNVLALMARANCRTVTFGFSKDNQWKPANLAYSEYGCGTFDASYNGSIQARVALRVGGAFNVLNALAAIAAAHALGADMRAAGRALSDFAGVHRRFEHTGTVGGVKLYHDYGHNPTEMRGALSVAKRQPHRRLWAVMQPHTYSRVKRLFKEYIHCCDDADEVLVTDIYAARESDPGDIHSGMLVEEMRKAGVNVHLTPTFDDTEKYLREHWQPGDLVLTMGCGNINELNERIEKNFLAENQE
ncbi:MAG: UDP-N-acetylmuramate--L-alanine ligase, partial [Firmicutes bacterium]|nr:UDP-N-acetylmuramate--L-alanine ligase [Bacillota bacterium]